MTLNIKGLTCDTQHNNIQQDDSQQNDIQHNGIQQNDTQHNDNQQNDHQQDDTQHKRAYLWHLAFEFECRYAESRDLDTFMLNVVA